MIRIYHTGTYFEIKDNAYEARKTNVFASRLALSVNKIQWGFKVVQAGNY